MEVLTLSVRLRINAGINDNSCAHSRSSASPDEAEGSGPKSSALLSVPLNADE